MFTWLDDLGYLFLSPMNSKALIKCVRCRLKLLRSKRDIIIRQLRDDVAQLLKNGQDESAFARVCISIGIVSLLLFLYFSWISLFLVTQNSTAKGWLFNQNFYWVLSMYFMAREKRVEGWKIGGIFQIFLMISTELQDYKRLMDLINNNSTRVFSKQGTWSGNIF